MGFGGILKVGQKVGPKVGFPLFLYRKTYFRTYFWPTLRIPPKTYFWGTFGLLFFWGGFLALWLTRAVTRPGRLQLKSLAECFVRCAASQLLSPQGPRARQNSWADIGPILMRCMIVCPALTTTRVVIELCSWKSFDTAWARMTCRTTLFVACHPLERRKVATFSPLVMEGFEDVCISRSLRA